MESERVKKALQLHLIDMHVNGPDGKIEKLKKLRHWLVIALRNDFENLHVPYGGTKEQHDLQMELREAANQDPYSITTSKEAVTIGMVGMAAHEAARLTKDSEIRKAEERLRNERNMAMRLTLKKEYEEAFLSQCRIADLEHDVSEKKDRNEWCYLWELITCQLHA
jgi:hypothetical protein